MRISRKSATTAPHKRRRPRAQRNSLISGLVLCCLGLILVTGCRQTPGQMEPDPDPFAVRRMQMVEEQLAARDVVDPVVLRTMRQVPRHLFVSESLREHAYTDQPLPIAAEQTISQPYIVAFMTQALQLQETDKVLEIGTGSGYQAAVLAEIVQAVHTIEIVPELAKQSKLLLDEMNYENIQLRTGDGYQGWPEAAPFDKIIVTAAPPKIPKPLLNQLKVGGLMTIPVGEKEQGLILIKRTMEGYEKQKVMGVRFVPMTGKAQKNR